MRQVVGACWEGGDHHYAQYLNGRLAGLTIVNNETEIDEVIECINNCQEKLDVDTMDEIGEDTVSELQEQWVA